MNQLCQDSYPADVTSQWRKDWNSASVVNSNLVVDPTIRQPGFNLSRWQWSLLNHFCTVQCHCGACRKRWWQADSDLCACGQPQTMSDIVDSCPLTKLAGDLSKLHSADDDVVAWLTNYGGPQRMHSTTRTTLLIFLLARCSSWCPTNTVKTPKACRTLVGRVKSFNRLDSQHYLLHIVNCICVCFWHSLWLFCLCMKYLRNCWADLRQIEGEGVFFPHSDKFACQDQRLRSLGTRKTEFSANISGIVELICAIFTQKMCLVPLSDEVEGQGQRSRSPGTKNGVFSGYLGHRWMDMQQIHSHGRHVLSLVGTSSKVKVNFGSLFAVYVWKKHLCSSFNCVFARWHQPHKYGWPLCWVGQVPTARGFVFLIHCFNIPCDCL